MSADWIASVFKASVFVAAAIGFIVLFALARRIAPALRERHQRRVEHASRDRLVVMDPRRLWCLHWSALVFAFAVSVWWSGSLIVAAVAAGLAVALPGWLITILRKHRLQRFREQLPDFLMLVAGSLRAGSGLVLALSRGAAASPSPARQQLELLLADVRLGTPIAEAMVGLERRAPVEEVSLMATALRVGLESGGALAATLESLGGTMRRRLALEARVRALTAQGRLQAWVMALLPTLIVALFAWVDPPSFHELVSTEAGRWVLLVVAMAQVIGFRLVRRIVDIEV